VNGVGIDKINDQCGADVSPIIEGVGIINDSLGVLLDALRCVYDVNFPFTLNWALIYSSDRHMRWQAVQG
jgi:hypothetical protein